jgi:Xaa-Pro aminopeptidase
MMAGGRKLDQAIRLMRKRGLGGLLVYSDGSCNILRASYLRYFAGFAPMGPNNCAVVSARGRTALVVQPRWDAARAKRHSWIADVRGAENPAVEFTAAIHRLEISGPVGLAGGGLMPFPVRESLDRAGVDIHAADDLIEQIAAEKTPEEIALIRRTAAAADAGFDAFHAAARVGVAEYEIVAEVEYAMRRAGADDNFILISSGPHNRAMRAPTDRRVAPGDIVIGEITPVCEGQFVQICRTVSVGVPSAPLATAYELLARAYDAAVARVRSNVPASVIAATIDGVLTDAGYGEYCRPPYMRTRGHGFGVGSVAPGALIDADTNVPLVAGQAIVVHPNQYLPETGYLACGETLLVTGSGFERLSRTENKLYVSEA